MVVQKPKWRECWGVPPEVHYHLHCFEHFQLLLVMTTPDTQLLYLLSVCRLITILVEADDCGVVCSRTELKTL